LDMSRRLLAVQCVARFVALADGQASLSARLSELLDVALVRHVFSESKSRLPQTRLAEASGSLVGHGHTIQRALVVAVAVEAPDQLAAVGVA
jgi:hypothetical protein